MLKIQKSAPITISLLAINIAIYIADHAFSGSSLFSGGPSKFVSDELLLFPPYIIAGKVWVLFTYMFFHANALHLGMNMLGLWQMGPIAEELLGRTRFLLLYLLAGLFGGGVSLFQKAFSEIPSSSLGASGAIFGVMGIFFGVVWIRSRDSQEFLAHPYIRQSGTNILLFTFVTAFAGIGIDHYAHAGGFFAGGALTLFFSRFRVPDNKKQTAGLVLVILLIMTAYGIYPRGSEGFKFSKAYTAFEQGQAAFEKKDFAAAEAAYTEVIRNDPKHPPALFNLHLTQVLQGNFAGAIVSLETLEQILDLDPNLDRENTRGYVSLKEVRARLEQLRLMVGNTPR
jgi:membrane associated rhomboid family serine protease